MSSDHYARQLIQKYRLAVAIGVIKSTPETKSLNEHLTDLRSKIIDDKTDDMTICSDDFDIEFDDIDIQLDTSQHSDTILKDFNDVQVSNNDEFGKTITGDIFANIQERSQVQIQNEVRDIPSTYCETQSQSDVYITRESLTDVDKTFCDSIALINRDELITIDEVCNKITNIDEHPKVIDKNIHKNDTLDIDLTFYDNTAKHNQNKNETNTKYTANKYDLTNITTAFDSQATELYSIHTLAEDYTHVSQSQNNNFDISNKYIKAKNRDNADLHNRNIEDSLPINVINTEFGNNIKDVNLVNKINNNLSKVDDTVLGESEKFDSNTEITIGQIIADDKNEKDLLQENTDHENSDFGFNFKDINLVKKINKKLHEKNIAMPILTENVKHNTQAAIDSNISINIKENEENIHNLLENAKNTEFDYCLQDNNLTRKVSNKLEKVNIANIAMDLDEDLNTRAVSNSKDIIHNNYFHQSQNTEIGEISEVILNSFDTNTNQEKATLHDLSKIKEGNMPTQVFEFRQNDDVFLTNDNNKVTINSAKDITKNNAQNSENMTMQVIDFGHNVRNTNELNKDAFNAVKEISNAQNSENITMQVYNFSQNDQNVFSTHENSTVKEINRTNDKNSENMTMQVFDFGHIEHSITNPKIPKNVVNTGTTQLFDPTQNIPFDSNNPENDIENESVSSEEVSESVPFKVMEELNRVKSYLSRRVDRRMSTESSLDSGYRSDSQGRSRSAFQLSGAQIGQSAYCLYEHITRCPMIAATQEIVEEISQVLGQLIDRLHEEESYPLFLEELLHHVDTLIRSILTDEDTLLEKDEKIHRLFLLNKSIHLQKYSIEKLTDILENMHASLTANEELHELTNIQEVENLSYIFYILEVVIKKHMKNKRNDGSQFTEKNYPKKSSISDIWRRKWNPNFKEESKLDCSLNKKCVFTKCSEVLNKIVVECLDGYSLVAYAALQCFNLLQS